MTQPPPHCPALQSLINPKHSLFVLSKSAFQPILVDEFIAALSAARFEISGRIKTSFDCESLKRFCGATELPHPKEIIAAHSADEYWIFLIEGEGIFERSVTVMNAFHQAHLQSLANYLFYTPRSYEQYESNIRELYARVGIDKIKSNNQVEVIVYRLINGTPEYLMLKRSASRGGFWQPITGNLRFGENLEKGCIRELREETGLTEFEAIIDTQFSFTFFDDYRTQKEQVCGIRIAPDSPILLSDEHTEHRWVNYDEAIEQYLSYPGNKRALEALHWQIASRG